MLFKKESMQGTLKSLSALVNSTLEEDFGVTMLPHNISYKNDTFSNSTSSSSPNLKGDLIHDDWVIYIYTVNFFVICGSISLFGIIANIINIAVFRRLNSKETINISLLALAISDLLSLISLFYVSLSYSPIFTMLDLPISPIDLQLIYGAWTHITFFDITSFITAYVTFERCLAVAYPLKVKLILNPRRVKTIIIIIFVTVFFLCIPRYFTDTFQWVLDDNTNGTILRLVPTDDELKRKLLTYSHGVRPIMSTCSFLGVVLFTNILTQKLRQRAKWLKQNSTNQQANKSSIRDGQVIKMVHTVAIIFIICSSPGFVNFLALSTVEGFFMGGTYANTFLLAYSIAFACQGINSSINIFVYHKTNSNYRHQFKAMFW